MRWLLVVPLGLVAAGCGDGLPAPARGAPAAVLVHGRQVPYAGEVPWADVVADPANPRQVTVMADGQNMHGPDICVLPIERPVVHATATTVSILVAGYGRPLPSGIACGEPGRGPQRVRVTLPSALDHRAFIDASTGLRHPVLDPVTVPKLGRPVPSGYVPQPIFWEDRTGIVTRNWTSKACATGCLIQLRYAPPSSHAPLDQFGPMNIAGHVSINGSPAAIYRYRDRRGQLLLTQTALSWTRPDHSRIVLEVGGGARGARSHVPTEAQSIRFARSIR